MRATVGPLTTASSLPSKKVLPSVDANVTRSFFSRESGEGLYMLPNDEPGVRFNLGVYGDPRSGDFACHLKDKHFPHCVRIATAVG